MLEGRGPFECGLSERKRKLAHSVKVVYTGPVDALFDYCFGELEYRTVRFGDRDSGYRQLSGNVVVNYTEHVEVPYTRIIEHKHFEFGTQEKTVICESIQ